MGLFCIYGAGIVATSVYMAIKSTYNVKPETFLVSDREKNPDKIDNIPVTVLADWENIDSEMIYLIAVPQIHHAAIRNLFYDRGIESGQTVWIENVLENRIMEDFYRMRKHFLTARQILEQAESEEKRTAGGSRVQKIEVFQASSHRDRKLKNQTARLSYVRPIQAGAALADRIFLDLRDDVGDNISFKNGNYCELTAGYYAWKHSSADYIGLCHYRRIFDLSGEQLHQVLADRDIDVILPYPSVHFPNIFSQHIRYVDEQDWKAMLLALEERAPEYRQKLDQLFCGQFFYNFNMLIAKRKVFDDYCGFLFSVLDRAEELTMPKGIERSDRFAGYLGENLTTLYFLANRDRLKIVHTGKLWLD